MHGVLHGSPINCGGAMRKKIQHLYFVCSAQQLHGHDCLPTRRISAHMYVLFSCHSCNARHAIQTNNKTNKRPCDRSERLKLHFSRRSLRNPEIRANDKPADWRPALFASLTKWERQSQNLRSIESKSWPMAARLASQENKARSQTRPEANTMSKKC